jgi:hypothetical protein
MTRLNGLVILTISFYIMYGYLGLPGQGALAIPFLLNETVLAIVCGIMVFYHYQRPALALHVGLISLSALAISPFFLEIILPQGKLIRLFESGWFEVLKLLHYLVICSLMLVVVLRRSEGLRQLLGFLAIGSLVLGMAFGLIWALLPAFALMIASEYKKDGENRTVQLWIILTFLELTKLIAFLLS